MVEDNQAELVTWHPEALVWFAAGLRASAAGTDSDVDVERVLKAGA